MFEIDGCLPYGKNVAVSVTNACPLQCKHCITDSSPHTDPGLPNFEATLTNFLRRDDLGTASVTMTGGEPFYDLDRLIRLVKLAANQGLAVGAISSAFWAKSLAKANLVLDQLIDLTLLTLSTDVHHTDFVPRKFIKNAYLAAKARGIITRVRVCVQLPYTNGDKDILSYVRTFCAEEELEIQQIIPYGRSSEHKEFHKQEFSRQPFCPALGPHLLNNGEIIPCCNSIVPLRGKHPLYIGDGHDKAPLSESILDNILFVTLKVWGVDSISKYLYGEIGEKSACDVCADVCSDSSKWGKLETYLLRPEHRIRTYSFALLHFKVEGAEPRLRQAIADYAAERREKPEGPSTALIDEQT
jgi:pyruvate-formate lyase-activating enzyme